MGKRYTIDKFLEKNKQSRNLSYEELKNIKALCDTAMEFGFGDKIILGTGIVFCRTCIFKTDESAWVVWETDERAGFINPIRVFDNSFAACWEAIETVCIDSCDEKLDYFWSLSKKDIPESSLIDFALKAWYEYTPNKKRKLKKDLS